MLVFGATSNPINLVLWMKQNKIRFSLNKPQILCKNVIFSSVFNLMLKIPKIRDRRVIVFDSLEKLLTIDGIRIIEPDKQEFLKNFLLNNDDRGPSSKVYIKRIDYIGEAIQVNKEMGLLHKYNTSLYMLTKDLREKMKQVVLDYAAGKIDPKNIDQLINDLVKVRRGKTKENILDIANIIRSEEFQRIRLSVMALLKQNTLVDRTMVESVSSSNQVEPYDVHYLYSLLSKNKQLNRKTA
jgi:hypothetical protein